MKRIFGAFVSLDIGGALGECALRERYIIAPPSILEAAARSQRK